MQLAIKYYFLIANTASLITYLGWTIYSFFTGNLGGSTNEIVIAIYTYLLNVCPVLGIIYTIYYFFTRDSSDSKLVKGILYSPILTWILLFLAIVIYAE